MCSLKHSKTTPWDSHCTSPRHFSPSFPSNGPSTHHWAFQETISNRNWNTNIWEILFFITLKCTLRSNYFFSSCHHHHQPLLRLEMRRLNLLNTNLFPQIFVNRFSVSWMETYRSHSLQENTGSESLQCSHQPWCDKATAEGHHSKVSELTLNCMTMMLKKCRQL